MNTHVVVWFVLAAVLHGTQILGKDPIQTSGRFRGADTNVVAWWTLSSAAKVRPDSQEPKEVSEAIGVRCARNEYESVQVVIRPVQLLHRFMIEAVPFEEDTPDTKTVDQLEVLQARYVAVATPTDRSSQNGLWPDPLVSVREPVNLEPGTNHSFWVRLHVSRQARAGVKRSVLRLSSDNWQREIPVELTIYNFTLPDRMTCQTAFGFSPSEIFRYQGLQDEASKRLVLEKYWANLSAHHISPYDPAPLDPFGVTWPDVRPPKDQYAEWGGLRLVTNEVHSGKSALLIYDDKTQQNVGVTYEPLIAIPNGGLHLKFWFRTAIPAHSFIVSLNHYDSNRRWISGKNWDLSLEGNGSWQEVNERLTHFPDGAKFVRLNLFATEWSETGEKLGLVWVDDLSLQDNGTGAELIPGGEFERAQRTELCAPADQLRASLNFADWDRAMSAALDRFHFSSFSVPIPGLGGGTFYELSQPNLRGFAEDTPEYSLLLGSYCRQLEDHLRAKGWLDRSFIYWFDEPKESQFPYLQNGFAKLKRYCPDIPRMITKRVEAGLIGGPNIWCPISNEFQPEPSNARRQAGELFWWYVCTGPKAPYAGLFLDHSAPEMRIWLWQTFQRHISGVLVWQCNYWNSSTAYPDAQHPQNPFEDPMSWTTGYGTPAGTKLPWGNGDGRFIYPPLKAASGNSSEPILEGPVDSVRWEHLRDGIEDYEYLTILQHHLDTRRSSLAPEVLREYESLLVVPPDISRSMTDFAPDGRPIELRRDEIARAIEKL